MKHSIEIKYYHPILRIGLEDVRNAWLLSRDSKPIQLKATIHQGLLSYRIPISGKRISYKTLKKGLIKKNIMIQLPVYLLPF